MSDDKLAGWYPAPHADNALRYWDGQRWLDWTPEQAAAAAAAPAPPPPDDPIPHQGDVAPPNAAPEPARRSRKVLILSVAAGCAIVLLGIAALVFTVTRPSAIQQAGGAYSGSKPLQAFLDELAAGASPTEDPEAEDEDELDSEEFTELFEGVVSVEDNGRTLIVNTKSEDDDALGVSSLALDCIYDQLDVPKHVSERIAATRALDGRQEGDWEGFTATWSYHPDSGANVIIVQR